MPNKVVTSHVKQSSSISGFGVHQFFNGYQFYHVPSPTNAGGVAMYISNQLNHDAGSRF